MVAQNKIPGFTDIIVPKQPGNKELGRDWVGIGAEDNLMERLKLLVQGCVLRLWA